MNSKLIKKIYKRDGSVAPFDLTRIVQAIYKAMLTTNEGSLTDAEKIANIVKLKLEEAVIASRHKVFPDVEGIQDDVEDELMFAGYTKTAKAYITYRKERADARKQQEKYVVSEKVKKLAQESKKYFRNTLSEIVYLRSYAKWIEDEGRRETWIETVDRYMQFMQTKIAAALSKAEYAEIRKAILQQQVMPSMRLLQFSGKAVEHTNVCAYNCAFIAPTKLRDFGEIMYVLMCGSGLGFSVEHQVVHDLPKIQPQTGEVLAVHVIEDSKEGWCDALVLGLQTWYAGKDISFNYSKLRPLGARLKTMGGKSSGPEPLKNLLKFARQKIMSKQGRRLTTIDVHDIICKIGEIVVSGGVRRSAMISLSDLYDIDLRDAKTGQFYHLNPQRSIANNSTVYNEKPDNVTLLSEWLSLAKSGSGERGMFNRAGLINTLPERRIKYLRKHNIIKGAKIIGILGLNPCAEIILQSKQFCNLTEVVARVEDTEETLLHKIKIATILGTYQATLTKFPYLSEEWRQNCEQERLLGVSITGQWDCPAVRNPEVLQKLKAYAIEVNQEYAEKFGINASTCISCVKPSGTVSQVVDCSSGMHARYAPYYIRRIRMSATDVLFKMLKDQGVPYHPEIGQTHEEANTYVLEFPVAAPKGAKFKNDLTAIEQLNYWKLVQENYTEHNPSVTISVDNEEWIKVLDWVNDNWDIVGGLSFFPNSEHVYKLAPYEEITKEQYEELVQKTNNIDFSKLMAYEYEDETDNKRELACAGGACELV